MGNDPAVNTSAAEGLSEGGDLLDSYLFSNATVDNILGPVAFYSLHGKEVDVVRYNKKFLEEVHVPHVQDHLRSIQSAVYEPDLPIFYELFEKAEADRQGGAIGVVRLRRDDGSLLQFRLHLYFAKMEERGKLFYSSVHDLAQLITPEDQRRLLSQAYPESVVFVRRKGVDWSFTVVIHGLEQEMALSSEDLEYELNSGRFEQRIATSVQQQMKQIVFGIEAKTEYFSEPFVFTAPNGVKTTLQVRFFRVQEEYSGVNYVLNFCKCGP